MLTARVDQFQQQCSVLYLKQVIIFQMTALHTCSTAWLTHSLSLFYINTMCRTESQSIPWPPNSKPYSVQISSFIVYVILKWNENEINIVVIHNIFTSYLGGLAFKSQPGKWFSWHVFSWFVSIPLDKSQDST
jgi:hypothetical protein